MKAEAEEESKPVLNCPNCGSADSVPCFIEALEDSPHYGRQRMCLLCKTIWTPEGRKA